MYAYTRYFCRSMITAIDCVACVVDVAGRSIVTQSRLCLSKSNFNKMLIKETHFTMFHSRFQVFGDEWLRSKYCEVSWFWTFLSVCIVLLLIWSTIGSKKKKRPQHGADLKPVCGYSNIKQCQHTDTHTHTHTHTLRHAHSVTHISTNTRTSGSSAACRLYDTADVTTRADDYRYTHEFDEFTVGSHCASPVSPGAMCHHVRLVVRPRPFAWLRARSSACGTTTGNTFFLYLLSH